MKKKAIMLLVAIGILAIAGGVAASRAKQIRIFFSDDGQGDCTIPLQTPLTTTSPNALGAFPTRIWPTRTTGLCSVTWVVTVL